MPAKKSDGPPVEQWKRHAPTLSRLTGKLAQATRSAFDAARPDRFAWPAVLIALSDVLLRGLAQRGFGPSGALQYAGRMLLMAALWGALGALLSIAFRLARRRRVFLLGVLLSALALLLLLGLSASHLAYFLVDGHFATPELLRAVWALRLVLLAYLAELPTVSGALLVAVAAPFLILLAQALRFAKSPRPDPRAGARACLLLAISAGALIRATTGSPDSLELAPPDAGSLSLLLQTPLQPTSTADMLRGAFRRRPLPVPKLHRRAVVRNVLVILTESVRADTMCSDPRECSDEFIDPAAPDRVGLTRLRTQAPGTFGTCMVLWTGLEPDSEYPASHRAPFLWEVARAAGYHTLYVTAQSPDFLDFGKYVAVAGIDRLITATDLQPHPDVMLGADDEKAMAALLSNVVHTEQPWYGVLHLANTHAMYRTEPSVQPYQPQSSELELGNVPGLKNRYRNAVALQRRSLAAFLVNLRALPSWDDTLVIFLSDHGEPLGDHGQLIHRDALFESSMRVPGWVLAGSRALSSEQRSVLEANRSRLLYTRDIHATVLDALGVWEQRQLIPYAELRSGRSLLRPMPTTEPVVPFANISGVWSFARPQYGAAQGNLKLIAGTGGPFRCFDLSTDPREVLPQPASACGVELLAFAQQRFPQVGVQPADR